MWWAGLRMAGSVWCGIAVVLFVAQTSIMLTALVMWSALTQASGLAGTAATEASLVAEVVGANGSILAVVVLVVVLVSVGAAVSASRRHIALWFLAGATPGQVVRMVLTQVVVVGVSASVPAAAAASGMLAPALRLLSSGGVGPAAPVSPVISLGAVAVGGAIGLVLAILGAWRSAVVAGRLAPVEVLRSVHVPRRRSVAARATRAVLATATLGLALLLGSTITSPRDAAALVTTPVFIVLLTSVLFALTAPAVFPLVVRAWTCVPVPGAAWSVARDISVARSSQLAAVVTPLALCSGLVMGLLVLTDTLVASIAAYAPGASDGLTTRPEIATVAIVFGLPVAVAAGGALGALLISARGRAVDLALPRLLGAGAQQSWWQAFWEGVILVMTSWVVGSTCVAAAVATQALGLSRRYGGVVLDGPWVGLGVCALMTAVLGGALVAGTTRAARRRPPHRVIAELVGE